MPFPFPTGKCAGRRFQRGLSSVTQPCGHSAPAWLAGPSCLAHGAQALADSQALLAQVLAGGWLWWTWGRRLLPGPLCPHLCCHSPPPTTTYHHMPSVLCVNTHCVTLLPEPSCQNHSFHFPQRRDQAPYTELVGPFRSNSNYHFCSRPHVGNTLQALEDPYASHKGQDGHSSKLCHTSFSFPEKPFLAIYTWKAPTHPSKPSSPDILGKLIPLPPDHSSLDMAPHASSTKPGAVWVSIKASKSWQG